MTVRVDFVRQRVVCWIYLFAQKPSVIVSWINLSPKSALQSVRNSRWSGIFSLAARTCRNCIRMKGSVTAWSRESPSLFSLIRTHVKSADAPIFDWIFRTHCAGQRLGSVIDLPIALFIPPNLLHAQAQRDPSWMNLITFVVNFLYFTDKKWMSFVAEVISGICDNNNEKDDDRGIKGKIFLFIQI